MRRKREWRDIAATSASFGDDDWKDLDRLGEVKFDCLAMCAEDGLRYGADVRMLDKIGHMQAPIEQAVKTLGPVSVTATDRPLAALEMRRQVARAMRRPIEA